jgi:hypothetical protein
MRFRTSRGSVRRCGAGDGEDIACNVDGVDHLTFWYRLLLDPFSQSKV